ncbi:MAG: MalY/PatB family protein [Chloroflexota bacterium]
MAAQALELSVEALRARRGTKWHRYPDDVLGAWVADMDFTVAAPVREAIARVVREGDYGYAARLGEQGLAAAFEHRMRTHFGWQADPALVQPVSDLIQALFAVIQAFTAHGDGVVVQTPIYPPFLTTIAQTGRRLNDNPLLDDGSGFVLDLDGLQAQVDERTRILLVCNPHNPTGRVFTRAELLALGELAVKRDLVVVCDEIHADLVYPGREFVPFATLPRDIAERTITITSATKGFNIPGLKCGVMYFGSAGLKQRFHEVIPERLLGQVNVLGVDATVAAWREGQPWLDQVMEQLARNRARVAQFIAAELPTVRHHSPEGTFLAWLDCRELNLEPSPYRFFLDRARVGLNDGADFGTNGETCVRLNFGTSTAILDQILDRMLSVIPA